MTIRDYLLRRWRIVTGALIAVAAASVLVVMLGSCAVQAVTIPLTFLAYGAVAFLSWFIMRCPQCHVCLDSGVAFGLSAKKPSRRFRFCPGCGVSLDAEVESVTAQRAAHLRPAGPSATRVRLPRAGDGATEGSTR